MGAIAEEVSGVSIDLVEKVLNEYGDPGESIAEQDSSGSQNSQSDTAEPSTDQEAESSGTGPDPDSVPSETDTLADDSPPADGSDEGPTTDALTSDEEAVDLPPNSDSPHPPTLTETQLETLRAIHEQPTATQKELAAQFDVTAASISQRVNSIDGFDWFNRRAFTEALFGSTKTTNEPTRPIESDGGTAIDTDGIPQTHRSNSSDCSVSDGSQESPEDDTDAVESVCPQDRTDQYAILESRLDQLEERLVSESGPRIGNFDPELTHKIVRACFDAEMISTEEEVEILSTLIGSDDE